jgi:hypothetical protein
MLDKLYPETSSNSSYTGYDIRGGNRLYDSLLHHFTNSIIDDAVLK